MVGVAALELRGQLSACEMSEILKLLDRAFEMHSGLPAGHDNNLVTKDDVEAAVAYEAGVGYRLSPRLPVESGEVLVGAQCLCVAVAPRHRGEGVSGADPLLGRGPTGGLHLLGRGEKGLHPLGPLRGSVEGGCRLRGGHLGGGGHRGGGLALSPGVLVRRFIGRHLLFPAWEGWEEGFSGLGCPDHIGWGRSIGPGGESRVKSMREGRVV
mmetsp:Transcript_34295/g.87862  ORF Transcript_34295/g.87862 Transcript_34295/m.87862 type:complete len:211 (+) Transcript_34295:788-1420(+)